MQKQSIFDFGVEDNHYDYKKVFSKKDYPIKLFEAFAGVGCQAMAFNRREFPYISVGISEIDKYAIKSYNAIHGKTKNYGDICKMESIPPCDIFTWSFPCTDLSKAGKQKGLNGTRSGLVYEVLRLLHITEEKPTVLIMENVVDLVQVKFMAEFYEIQKEIESLGYKNFTQTINAKHQNVAQNRDRVFMVSILRTETNPDPHYEFPPRVPLEYRLKDYLEESVDEKYYLSDKAIKGIKNSTFNTTKSRIQSDDETCDTICARDYKDPKCVVDEIKYEKPLERDGWHNKAKEVLSVDGIVTCIHTQSNNLLQKIVEPKCVQVAEMQGGKWDKMHDIAKRVYGGNGLAPTIHTMGGGNLEPKILEEPTAGIFQPKDRDYNKKGKEREGQFEPRTDGVSNSVLTHSIKNCIAIPEATKKGYAEAQEGDGVYINRPHQKRGVVQKGMIQTLKTSGEDVGVVVKGNYSPSNHNASRIVDKENLAPTVKENHGTVTAIEVINPLKDKSDKGWHFEQQVYDEEGITRSVKANGGSGNIPKVITPLRIRKLTPKEYWRLMGIDDQDFEKAQAVVSNSQLYKQAGNGIVVDVFANILKGLIE